MSAGASEAGTLPSRGPKRRPVPAAGLDELLAVPPRSGWAREHLRAAHGMFSRFGGRGVRRPALRELQATGETVRKRTTDTREALTVQEAQVARLAAEGHTNPEIGAQLFISSRTAEYHLRKVFSKLGVSSRLAGPAPPGAGVTRTAHRLSASPRTVSWAGDPR